MKTVQGSYSMRHGTEGPRHDPYGFTETTFQSDKLTVTLHQGLAQWMQVNHGPKTDFVGDQYDNDEAQAAAFKQLAGLTPHEIEKYEDKLTSKCRKCGSSDFEEASGHPGESFTICAKCGAVVDYHFNESVVI
jgi:hypothetical protein